MPNGAELLVEIACKIEPPKFCAELILETGNPKGFYNKLFLGTEIDFASLSPAQQMLLVMQMIEGQEEIVLDGLIETIGDNDNDWKTRRQAALTVRGFLNQGVLSEEFIKENFAIYKRFPLKEEIVLKAIESLIKLLKGDNPSIRRWAIFALGTRKDLYVVKSLIEMLYDKDFEVKRQAVIGLRNPIAVEPLITLLSDDNEKIRKYAAYSLGVIRDFSAVKSLIRLFKNETKLDVKLATIEALRRIGSQKAVEFMNKFFEDNSQINVAIKIRISIRGNQRAVEFLKGLLDNPKADIRRRAVQALVFEDPTLVDSLIEFLKSDKRIGVHLDIASLFQRYPDIVKNALLNTLNKGKIRKDAIKNVLRLAGIRNPEAYLQYLLKRKDKDFSYISFLTSDDKDKISECCKPNLKVGNEAIAILTERYARSCRTFLISLLVIFASLYTDVGFSSLITFKSSRRFSVRTFRISLRLLK